MKVKDLKLILNAFHNDCPIEFEDENGKRHTISNIKSDSCLVFWTMLLSERNFDKRKDGQEIIWHN